MGKFSEYAVAQRCEGYDDYFAKRSEYLREGTKRDAVRAKTPAISAFVRKQAEEECDSKDEKKKEKEKSLPPWMKEKDNSDAEEEETEKMEQEDEESREKEKEAKAKSSRGARFKKLVKGIKKNDMKDGKKDIDNPFAVAASFTANQKKKASSAQYPHLARFMEKTGAENSHIGPSAEAGALSGGALGGLGGLLGGGVLGGITGYGLGQETQGLFDEDYRPYGTAALGALLGAAGGGLGGAALGAGSGAFMGAGEGFARDVLEKKYGPMQGHVGPHLGLGALGGAGLGALSGGAQGAALGAAGGPLGAIGGGLGGAAIGGLGGAIGGAGHGALRGATRSMLEKKSAWGEKDYAGAAGLGAAMSAPIGAAMTLPVMAADRYRMY